MDQELPHIYTVSALTREIRDRLETYFSLVWVSGEISNLRQPLSGHYYFTLKDAGAQLKAVLFKGTPPAYALQAPGGQASSCAGGASRSMNPGANTSWWWITWSPWGRGPWPRPSRS